MNPLKLLEANQQFSISDNTFISNDMQRSICLRQIMYTLIGTWLSDTGKLLWTLEYSSSITLKVTNYRPPKSVADESQSRTNANYRRWAMDANSREPAQVERSLGDLCLEVDCNTLIIMVMISHNKGNPFDQDSNFYLELVNVSGLPAGLNTCDLAVVGENSRH